MDPLIMTARYQQYGPGIRLFLLILGLSLFSSSCTLQAQTRTRDVKPFLQGYEWELAPERFVCMGKGVDAALREVASDETLPNYYRQRALIALSLFPNPKTASFLEQVISDSGSHPSHVQRALYAYSDAFADKQSERVTEVARNALSSSGDYQIKTAAAETLAGLRTSEAKAALRDYMNSDLSKLQRQHIRYMMRQPSAKPVDQVDRSGAVSSKQFTCPQKAPADG